MSTTPSCTCAFFFLASYSRFRLWILCHSTLVRLWRGCPRRHSSSSSSSSRYSFSLIGYLAVVVMVCLLLVLFDTCSVCCCYYWYSYDTYLELESTGHTAFVPTTLLSNSGLRCKPSPYSSAACGSFCHHKRLPPSSGVVAPCTLLLRAASGGPGFTSFKKATRYRRIHLSWYPLLLFVRSSRPRKSYLNKVKTHATRTDRASKSCYTYRRWYSDMWMYERLFPGLAPSGVFFF